MTRQQVLDLYFMENRAKLIDLAAFLDRVDRATGDADFRLAGFMEAMKHLSYGKPERAKNVLLSLSDPTTEPIERAPGKGAVGAWPGLPYGDPFVVYPGPDGPIDSIRWEVLAESLQDYAVLQSAGIHREDPLLAPLKSYEDFPKQASWIEAAIQKVLS